MAEGRERQSYSEREGEGAAFTDVVFSADLPTHRQADWGAAAESSLWKELVPTADVASISQEVEAQFPEIYRSNGCIHAAGNGGEWSGGGGGDGGGGGGGDGGGGGGGDGGGGGGA